MITVNRLAVAIDIGGTFTDILIQDITTGEIINISKVATTTRAPEKAFLQYLETELQASRRKTIERLYHATTIATNAFLGQMHLTLPKTALITTRGFRDVLEIGRQRRSELYNLFFDRPKPIIPRRYRFEVTERLASTGEILTPLKLSDLDTIEKKIRDEKIESVAITLLHSYKSNMHEKKIKEFLEERNPQLFISASFEVSPEHREFERTSTTAINALLMPFVSKYLRILSEAIEQLGIQVPLYIMQSNGGVGRSDVVQRIPVSIIESGPSAGVVAASFFAKSLDLDAVLSFDMGGTTAKAGTIVNKVISLTSEYEVGGEVHAGRITKGSGYPVRFPFIDLAEISSGGGSIAWIDAGGALQVGPISAGSEPGPVCYGQGGKEPTITDANLLLGRLNPKGLLNQTFKIYPDLAKKSLLEKICKPLGLGLTESAFGIIKIANNNMSKILRIVTVERGLDPRDFSLLAFGGAGPLHACALASALQIKTIYIPSTPGLFSAMGLLYTDAKHSFVKSIRLKNTEVESTLLEDAFLSLEEKGKALLKAEGFTEETIVHQRFIEARYQGQGFELQIPITSLSLADPKAIEKITALFHAKHKSLYRYILETEPVEIVNIRSNSLGIIQKPTLRKIAAGTRTPPAEALLETRQVYFDVQEGFIETPVYLRNKLLAGNRFTGPAVIEQYDSTTIVEPSWHVEVEKEGVLKLTREWK
ncbi:MAG: hydantoinase/oxoprolinase family protein [Candidatus Heimdallarchaeota archaeon]|nr:hydantoinase/oxoprolinase family protein [Candidatus Heimdallarchaeota archaeon]